MIKAIIFLGNPGKEYELTRHNVAWLFAKSIYEISNASLQKKFKGEYIQVMLRSHKVHVLWPQTFMNKSGGSVQAMLAFFKLSIDEILVVHDEIEIEFGEIGIRQGGGLAGHNGLRSIASSIGSKDFYRFRIGVSKPAHGNVSSYVLSKFNKNEQAELPAIFQKSERFLLENLQSPDKDSGKIKLL